MLWCGCNLPNGLVDESAVACTRLGNTLSLWCWCIIKLVAEMANGGLWVSSLMDGSFMGVEAVVVMAV